MVVDPQAESEVRDEDRGRGPETFFVRYESDMRNFLVRLYTLALILVVLGAAAVLFLARSGRPVRAEAESAPENERPGVVGVGEDPLRAALEARRWGEAAELMRARQQVGAATPDSWRGAYELAQPAQRGELVRWQVEQWRQRDPSAPELPVLEVLILEWDGSDLVARNLAARWDWQGWEREWVDWVVSEVALPMARRDVEAGRLRQLLEWLPVEAVDVSNELFRVRQQALLGAGLVAEARLQLGRVSFGLDAAERWLAEGDLELASGRPVEAEIYWKRALGREGQAVDPVLVQVVAERALEGRRDDCFLEVMDRWWSSGSGLRGAEAMWASYVEVALRRDRLRAAWRVARALEVQHPEVARWWVERMWCEVLEGRVSQRALAEVQHWREQQSGDRSLIAVQAAIGLLLRRPEEAQTALNELAGWADGGPARPREALLQVLTARALGQEAQAAAWQEQLDREALLPAERRWLESVR